MRSVYLGTPEAAIPALESLAAVSAVTAVLTQPDRPKGRSKTPTPPPVKIAAEALGFRVLQPETSREIAPILNDLGPFDVAVVVAYGMLIRPDALAVPRRGFVNLHFSVLPRWRGAAPVQRALEAGDDRTGVTLMQLDEGLDTGPILSALSPPVSDPAETSGEVLERLAVASGHMLTAALADHVEGRLVPLPQDEAAGDACRQDHLGGAEVGTGRIRASRRRQDPRPEPESGSPCASGGRAVQDPPSPRERFPESGTWHRRDVDRRRECAVGPNPGCQTSELMEVQPAGKQRMPGAEWARGRHGHLGVLT